MKTLLIIYPHWVPSNLVGVQRSRLIANFLKEFGWHPIILSVHPDFYEEPAAPELSFTVNNDVEVIFVNARKARKRRIVGDIALRAFGQLKKEAIQIIKTRKIDFLWIPVPSYYSAIIGRLVHNKTNIPYGIDFIDPWVREIDNYSGILSKEWLSIQVAKILEPIVIKKASLISGVAEHYYLPAIKRNFKQKTISHVAMPYGFDENDYNIQINDISYPWESIDNCMPFIYAGAFLPKSHLFINALFKSLKHLKDKNILPVNAHFFFIGTGHYKGKSIMDYATEYELDNIIHENRDRISYLKVIQILKQSFCVMVIGSTEKHYTASKTFQAILSKRPVFSIFHKESTAAEFLKESKTDTYLTTYEGGDDSEVISQDINKKLTRLLTEKVWNPDFEKLNNHSARYSAKALVDKIEEIL